MKNEKSFKKFIFLWITQSISEIGSAVTLFSLIIWLTQTFEDPSEKQELAFSLAAVNIAFALGYILIQPYTGVLVDRFNRRHIMLISNYISGILTFTLVFLLVFDYMNVPLLVMYNACIAICRAFHMAAFSSSFILVVPEKHLSRANAMTQASFNSSEVLGPVLATFLIAVPNIIGYDHSAIYSTFMEGIPFAISIDAISFIVGAFALHFLYFPTFTKREEKAGFLSSFREGIKFINKPLYWLLAIVALSNLFIPTIIILQPLLVKYHLSDIWTKGGISYDSALATLNSVNALGGIMGAVILTFWGGIKSKKVYGVVIPMIIIGILQIFYGVSNLFYLTAAIGFFIFFLDTLLSTHSHTIWQSVTPAHLQGRVFAARRMLAQITWPLSGILAGWIGSAFNVVYGIIGIGIICTILSFLFLFNRSFLSVDNAIINEENVTKNYDRTI